MSVVLCCKCVADKIPSNVKSVLWPERVQSAWVTGMHRGSANTWNWRTYSFNFKHWVGSVTIMAAENRWLLVSALSPSCIDLYWIWSTTHSHLTQGLNPQRHLKDSEVHRDSSRQRENEWSMAHPVPKGNFGLAKSQCSTSKVLTPIFPFLFMSLLLWRFRGNKTEILGWIESFLWDLSDTPIKTKH